MGNKNPELKGSIPEFVLIQEKTSFGEGRVRVQTTVINIETRLEDAEYLKQLLVEATKGRKMPGTFVEIGYHLTDSTKGLMAILNNQNDFLNDSRVIPVMGISQEIMDRIVDTTEMKTLKQHLVKTFSLTRIERTSQVDRLGKWMFMMNAGRLDATRKLIDQKIGDIVAEVRNEGEEIEDIRPPRRTNGPSVTERHGEYLAAVRAQTGIGDSIEKETVRSTKENGQKRWKTGYSNPANPSGYEIRQKRSYAEAAKEKCDRKGKNPEGEQKKTKQKQDLVRSKEEVDRMDNTGDSLAERNKSLDERLEAALSEQMRKTEELLYGQKEESTEKFIQLMEDSRRRNADLMSSLIKGQEERMEVIVEQQEKNFKILTDRQKEEEETRKKSESRQEARLEKLSKELQSLVKQLSKQNDEKEYHQMEKRKNRARESGVTKYHKENEDRMELGGQLMIEEL